MKVTILGGASFLGYWIKEGLKHKLNNVSFQIIDAPRKGSHLIKRYNEDFVLLNKVSGNEIIRFSPSIILINLYDLLSYSSLNYSVENNNVLIEAINYLLDISRKLNSKLILFANKNIYTNSTLRKKGKGSYYHTFNIYNSFYIDYIKTYSKVYNLRTNIFLLPNVFGLYEPRESVISSIIRAIFNCDKVKLSGENREFVYVKRIVPEIIRHILQVETNETISFSTEKFTEMLTLYNIISNQINQKSKVEEFDDKVKVERMLLSEEYTLKTIYSNLDIDIKDYISYFSKYR